MSVFIQGVDKPTEISKLALREDTLEKQIRSSGLREADLEKQVLGLQQSLRNASRLESMVQDLQAQVADQEKQMTFWHEALQQHLQAANTCPFQLHDFSKLSMIRAGWTWDMNHLNFEKSKFTGWSDGRDVGTMTFRIPSAGSLTLLVTNTHFDAADPDNFVRVFLNHDLVVEIPHAEAQQVCLTVEAGDELTLVEIFAQIQLSSLELECLPPAKSTSSATLGSAASGMCRRDQQVWVPASRYSCSRKQPQLAPGQIERVLNETRAIVRLTNQSSGPTSQYKIVRASRTFLDSSGNAPNCQEFEFRRQSIGIVLVINAEFQARYVSQIKSQRCFASWRGYDHVILDTKDFPTCAKYASGKGEPGNGHADWRDFFFQKHCVIAEFLGQQVAGYVAVVIDGDVVAAALERGVEEWTRIDADIQFYERIWCTEIAAGNYIVRNTPWARAFLHKWASYVDDQPSGFSSSDNGAIHLHIVRTLQLEGAENCAKMYHGISSNLSQVSELDHDLDGYFKFVNCTRRLLGPPRLWHAHDGGRLAMWGRAHFFVADGVYLAMISSDYFGPVFHHGIKEQSVVLKEYYSDLDQCKVRPSKRFTREQFIRKIFSQVDWLTSYLARLGVTFPEVARGQAGNCTETKCFKPCVLTLSCPLLKHGEAPLPHQLLSS